MNLPPFVREDVEPPLSDSGRRWDCPWPGCPHSKVYGARKSAREHAREPHVRCSCGRYFAERGYPAHKAQTKRYGIAHPPFPDDDS